jgi:thymidylate synthase (FAD)
LILDPLNDRVSSVALIDHMGSDLSVVNAARVSMAKESAWMNDSYGPIGDTLSMRDCGLISYLAKHKHWTPFSHPQITLRIKMPICVARQWFKSMVGFTRNEVSRRYVDDTPEFYEPGQWRKRAENVKQGSSDELAFGGGPSWEYTRHLANSRAIYEAMLDAGVAPEMARMVLPQSTYTEFIETGSLAAYARLAGLRLDPHAQREIAYYAAAIDDIMAELFPVSWDALRAHE